MNAGHHFHLKSLGGQFSHIEPEQRARGALRTGAMAVVEVDVGVRWLILNVDDG